MKTSLACLIIALFWNIAATQQVANYTASSKPDSPWLHVCYPDGNMIPERTVIHTTRPPHIRQVLPGIWQITFPTPK